MTSSSLTLKESFGTVYELTSIVVFDVGWLVTVHFMESKQKNDGEDGCCIAYRPS